jgi:hypothetical protein
LLKCASTKSRAEGSGNSVQTQIGIVKTGERNVQVMEFIGQREVNPSPVTVLMPDEGDAAATSCLCWQSLFTSFVPMSPLPPLTAILVLFLFVIYVLLLRFSVEILASTNMCAKFRYFLWLQPSCHWDHGASPLVKNVPGQRF